MQDKSGEARAVRIQLAALRRELQEKHMLLRDTETQQAIASQLPARADRKDIDRELEDLMHGDSSHSHLARGRRDRHFRDRHWRHQPSRQGLQPATERSCDVQSSTLHALQHGGSHSRSQWSAVASGANNTGIDFGALPSFRRTVLLTPAKQLRVYESMLAPSFLRRVVVDST
jgi:hypothetical protein